MEQLEEVVSSSAACNVAQRIPESGVVWRDWDTFLLRFFRRIPMVSKMHHFSFKSTEPGVVHYKRSLTAEEQQMDILKASKEEVVDAGLPDIILPGGLSDARRQYLLKEIRQYVPADHKEGFCSDKEH